MIRLCRTLEQFNLFIVFSIKYERKLDNFFLLILKIFSWVLFKESTMVSSLKILMGKTEASRHNLGKLQILIPIGYLPV